MHRSHKVLLVLTLGFCGGGFAGPAGAPQSGVENPGVSRATLRPWAFRSKYEYVLGEPVYLHVVLSNASSTKTYEVSGAWHPANDFEIMIARARGLPRRFTAGVKGILRPEATYKIRPKSLIAQRWTLCYDPDRPTGFAFDEPGVYAIQSRVRVRVDNYPQSLNLGTLQIQVTEPSADQKKALSLIMRPECAEDLQRDHAQDATVSIWQRLVREHPKCLWAPYARLLLARYAWTNSTMDYERLAGEFESIVADFPGFVLADEVYYSVATSYDRAGKTRKALEWLNRLQRRFPMSRRIREGDPLFQKYIYRQQWEARYAPWYLKE